MKSNRKFNKSKEWLYEEYVVKNRTITAAAKDCGLSHGGLKSVLAKYNIKKPKFKRPVKEVKKLLSYGKSTKEIAEILHCGQTTVYRIMADEHLTINYKPIFKQRNKCKDELICSLYKEGKSSVEISAIVGLTPSTTINHLQQCNIKIRSLTESHFLAQGKQFPMELTSYDFVYNLYITKHKSKKEIAQIFNIDSGTVDKILRDFNIPVRSNSESKVGLMCGKLHPNWRGGITSLGARLREAFGVQLVPLVLKRDSYECQLCGSKKCLHVHHIKPFKEILNKILLEHPNLNPIDNLEELYKIAVKDYRFLDINNLITYCKNCHFYKIHKYETKYAENKQGELLETPTRTISSQASNVGEGSETISKESTLK